MNTFAGMGTRMVLVAAVACTTIAAEELRDLSLSQALDIAWRGHPGLSQAMAELRATDARSAGAGIPPNPELVARLESAPLRGGTTSEAEYLAGVSQAVPIGGRLAAGRLAGRAAVELHKADMEAEVLKIRQAVEGAFTTALFSAEAAKVQTSLASSMQELVSLLEFRVAEGDAAPVDLTRARAEEARERLHAKEAERLHEEALRALAAALGDHSLRILSLQGHLDAMLELDRMKASLAGLSGHPAIAAAEGAVRLEDARLQLARAERIPDVNLDLFYRRLQADRRDAFDLGLSVAVPLFEGRHRVREAQQKSFAAQARLARLRNELGYEFQSRARALDRELEVATVFREEILPGLDEAESVTQVRFTAGDVSLIDLLLVRREAATARLEYLGALRRTLELWSALKY
jgi:outer membrane protein, heavy metal efflux system